MTTPSSFELPDDPSAEDDAAVRLHIRALLHVLSHHAPRCTIHLAPGIGACSCGRNAALSELATLLLNQLSPSEALGAEPDARQMRRRFIDVRA